MKICLLADWSRERDEGMKKVAHYLREGLSQNHEVLPLDPRQGFNTKFWKRLSSFQPQIVHYLPGPSIASFFFTKAVKICFPGIKTVMSALHPSFYDGQGFSYGWSYVLSPRLKRLVPWLKPDLLLVQSLRAEALFQGLGCHTAFLPNGVDTRRFCPPQPKEKGVLREKYGLNTMDFIVLHVGSIERWRNLEIFLHLPYTGLIVGSTSTGVYPSLLRRLRAKGCLIWLDYFPQIEEIYALADCYLFPARRGIAAIEMPLGVLEAMSCNLPVVTTPFGALPRVFTPGKGLYFAESDEHLLLAVEEVKKGEGEIKTREKVIPLSWEGIIKRVETIYENLLSQGKE